MPGSDCGQQAIDLNWSLTRENACHLSVQNHEMGELRDYVKEIGWKVDIMVGATIPIYLAVMAIVVKRIWSGPVKQK